MAVDIKPKQNFRATARNIADVLFTVGILGKADFDLIKNYDNSKIEEYARKNLKISDEVILKAYSVLYNLPIIALDFLTVEPNYFTLLSKEEIAQFKTIVYSGNKNQIDIAISDPKILPLPAPLILSELEKKKNINVSIALVPKNRYLKILQNYSLIAQKADNKNTETNFIRSELEQLRRLYQGKNTAMISSQPWIESHVPLVDLTSMNIPLPVITRIPEDIAKKYQIIVFETFPSNEYRKPPKVIKIAMVNPQDPEVKKILDFIRAKNKIEILKFVTSPQSLNQALKLYHQESKLIAKINMASQKNQSKKLPPDLNSINTNKQSQNSNMQRVVFSPSRQNQPAEATDLKIASQKLLQNHQNPSLNQQNLKSAKVDIPNEFSVPEQVINIDSSQIKLKPQGLKEVEESVQSAYEETNLDKFLSFTVKSPKYLADVFMSGLVPQIVASLVSYAVEAKASDIHIEPQEKYLNIRYRIDGELQEIIRAPMFLHASIVSRIKILTKLKIDEQRIPQDGRFNVQVSGHKIDLRVSTMPTVFGEKIVMRVLDKSVGIFSLEQLGMTGSGFEILVKNIKKPYGIILASGPTGSGKSTTLYAVLQRLSKPGVNIVTLEDPVEYELEGINQCQIKPKIGFTFAQGLRSVLRQDPNIIMVGEIRDAETASLATHAALTGHLVLSSIHTNDASGVLPRLINMGIEPFLITSSINAIVAQRLVRKICQNCKEEYSPPSRVIEELKEGISELKNIKVAQFDETQLKFYRGKGCDQCSNGYKGRIGIYEVLPMSKSIESLAVKKAPASDILKQATAEGMITMKQDGILKTLKGITTIDEILRVTIKT